MWSVSREIWEGLSVSLILPMSNQCQHADEVIPPIWMMEGLFSARAMTSLFTPRETREAAAPAGAESE